MTKRIDALMGKHALLLKAFAAFEAGATVRDAAKTAKITRSTFHYKLRNKEKSWSRLPESLLFRGRCSLVNKKNF